MKLSSTTALSVVDALASHFAIRDCVEDIRSPSRTEPLALRRAEVMYVLWKFGMSYNEIGRMFDREHTTVMASCQRVCKRLDTAVGYRKEIDLLIDMARGVVVMTQKRERMDEQRKAGRERLADERNGYVHKVEILAAKDVADRNAPSEIEKIDLYIHVGEYPNGKLGEIFLTIGKHGSIHAVYDQWAHNTSLGLQWGIPVEVLFRSCVGTIYDPAGATSNKEIPRCTSILDYVGRWILGKYNIKQEINHQTSTKDSPVEKPEPAVHIDNGSGQTLCGAPAAKLTTAALESDCENCRAHPSVMVGPVGQKGCEQAEASVWEPQPMADADVIVEAVKKARDGGGGSVG